MKDYMVTKSHEGLAYYNPRIVRAESAREALEAVLVSTAINDPRIRKLPNQNLYRVFYVEESYYTHRTIELFATYEVKEWAEVSDEYKSRFWKLNPLNFIRLNRKGEFVKQWSTADNIVSV